MPRSDLGLERPAAPVAPSARPAGTAAAATTPASTEPDGPTRPGTPPAAKSPAPAAPGPTDQSEPAEPVTTGPAEPATTRPAAPNASTQHPSPAQPTNGQPATEQPANGQPADGQRTTAQPTTPPPAKGQPTTARPANGQPASAQVTTTQVTTPQPTAPRPTTAHTPAAQAATATAVVSLNGIHRAEHRDASPADRGRQSWPEIFSAHDDTINSAAGEQLAALIARAAHAPGGLVHFVDGEALRIYGSYGMRMRWEDIGDTPLRDSLAGLVVADGRPLVITDFATDPRIPANSPIRRRGLSGAYLGQPIRDASGAVLGICCALDTQPHEWSADDVAAVGDAARLGTLLITEQQGRQEVDRQRRFLDAVLDNLHDGVTACDADGRVVLVNARMQRLWGGARMPADLSDHPAVAGPSDGDGLSDGDGRPIAPGDVALFRALRGERLRNEELVLQGRGGRTRYYLIDAQPILGPDGETVGAVQAVQDVTRQRRAERFRTCELAVVTALAAAPTIEAAGPRVLEAVVGTLGWTHAELWLVDEAAGVVRSAASWNSPSWQSDIEVPAELPYGTGLPGRAWQAGKPLWIRDVGRPQSLISPETAESSRLHTALAIPVRNGLEPLGVLTAFADTIEDPEDELVALMSGISAQIAQFIEKRLVDDLQRQLIRTKNEYLALIGHELRTPLTSIAAYTELLRDADAETLVAEGPRLLEVIDRNATQLRHIINELLELSALDTGHAAVQLSPINLAELVRESVQAARDAITDEPVSIVDELPDELVLPGDRHRLRQVVDNLLGNAVKYSPDGGRIAVRLRTTGRAAELSISDTGIGVSQEEREKMFTGLYRTSRARDRAIPGSGLGLTLSRAVVQRHHGTIELSEHEGPGTTVSVRLPLDAR
ncbi:ATP-binding protein [Actinoplanes sp. CA-051413]|uniref:ATP-binding protein n=1 Tax=Actinoplanes sp. CA-051413 TaxID=3239899 RepID=UPI003D966048